MKIQIDVPEDVHKQLSILKPIGGFKTLANTAEYLVARNIGELVSKEAKTLRREIKKERKDVDAEVYSKDDVDSKKTKMKKVPSKINVGLRYKDSTEIGKVGKR